MGRFTMVCVLCALVGVHSAVAFSRVVVRIFEGSNNFPALHFPRTDAAECDSHFYVLFSLGKLSLEDFRRRVIDTVLYRGQLFGFSIYLFIFVHAGEDIARWGTTGPTDRRSLFGFWIWFALDTGIGNESVVIRWSFRTLARSKSEAGNHSGSSC